MERTHQAAVGKLAATGVRRLPGLLALVLLLLTAASTGGAFASEPPQDPPDQAIEDLHDPNSQAESGEDTAEREEGEDAEVSHDAIRDPVLGRVIHRRRLIDKPRFSLETGGKIQVQYYDADSDDPENEDEWLLRRFRPFLLGHFAENWLWKFELELSSQITALDFDSNDLDIRDAYIRYEGFEREGSRLTLGNQKVPFSRDFMTPSTRQYFVERIAVGQTQAGVPDRAPGAHYRRPSRSGRLVLWASLATASHKQDVRSVKLESTVGASSDLNLGLLAVGRLDVRPRGALRLGTNIHYDLGFAGYHWNNDGSRNTYTSQGSALDPEKADLDRAHGLELSVRLKAANFKLEAQVNRIHAETVVAGFTGGLYVDGETELNARAVQLGYRIPDSWVQFTGGFSRLDSDGYTTPWDQTILGLNVDPYEKYAARLQISHHWISNRFGIPNEDFQETRLQLQYAW